MIKLFFKTNKLNIILRILVISPFIYYQEGKTTYYCLLTLAYINLVSAFIAEYFYFSRKHMDKGWHDQFNRHFYETVKGLVSELNYPTMSKERRLKLFSELEEVKRKMELQ